MEIGTILLPAYLRDTEEARVYLKDNRRYTMRDIGDLADRITNLEEVTSLNLLEKTAEVCKLEMLRVSTDLSLDSLLITSSLLTSCIPVLLVRLIRILENFVL